MFCSISRSLLSKFYGLLLIDLGICFFHLCMNMFPSCVQPNSVSRLMYTPLVLAIVAHSIHCVRLLLKAGANPNLGSLGVSPLTVAVSEGQTKIVKCLLKAGADPNVTNFYDFTPLQIAAMCGSRADVRALLQATTPIPSIPDWSVDGILEYVQSAEAENQRKSKIEQKFHEAKAKGAEAVTRNDYLEAVYWYTEAITAKPKDAAVISNRSLCWACLNEGSNALKDAMACIILRPDWPKAYYQAGAAWRILKDYKRAAEAFEMGLMMDPENEDLQDAKREAEAASRAARMSDSRGTLMDEDAIDSDDLCSMM